MDALHEFGKARLDFTKADSTTAVQQLECRYPMVFRPRVIYGTTVSRSVDITQPQFEAATTHTQVLNYYKTQDTKNLSKIYCTENINVDMQQEIRKAHIKAVWVVCVDQAIDKACIKAIYGDSNCPVIGFSTGQGSFGQLNLTITTRSTVGNDIKERCKNRLRAIFGTWSDADLEKASGICLKRAPRLDGVKLRILLEESAAKEAKTVLSAMQQFLDSDLFDTTGAFDWQDVTERDGKVTVIQLTGLDRTLQTILTEITLILVDTTWGSLIQVSVIRLLI